MSGIMQYQKVQKKNLEMKNSLVGDVSMREPKPTIRTKQTMEQEGFGKIISGLFLVEKVTNRFSASDGYTQTIGVEEQGLGTRLKAMVVIPHQNSQNHQENLQ